MKNLVYAATGLIVGIMLGLALMAYWRPLAPAMNSGFALAEPIEGYLSARCNGFRSDRVVAIGYAGPTDPKLIIEVDHGAEYPESIEPDGELFCTFFRPKSQ